MAEKLTPQQQMAVSDRGGKLLVSAAAGSGKTKVLVDRLLSYLTDPVSPANLDDFLIITYTKAAASELRDKIASKLSDRIAQEPSNRHLQQQMQRLYLAKISTVHSFCGDLLKEYAYKLDLPADFRVAEETECLQLQTQVLEKLLNEAYDRIGTDKDLQTFVDTQGFGRNDKMIPEIILKVYNSARCHIDPEGWLQKCLDETEADGIADASETVWGKYLIARLKNAVKMHISALERCLSLANQTEGYEKVCELLGDTIIQLKQLEGLEKWDDIVRIGAINFGTLRFPKKNADPVLADRIKAIRTACKDQITKLLSGFADYSDKVLKDLSVTGSAARGLVDLVNRFSVNYDRLKRARRLLDFGDLEHYTLQLFYGKKHTGLTAASTEVGARFREIMVDEYQDSNAVQDAIFSALTSKRNNCFMVGDVKQSIYQFRLADPGIFLEKYERFASAETAVDGEPRKILLSSNFRSAGEVIHAVNDVFAGCMTAQVGGLDYGEDEMLHEGIPHKPQTEPEIELYAIDVKEDTYMEESSFIADRIKELLDGSHTIRDKDGFRAIKPEDIVILLRSPGSIGAEFCYALEQKGIRCTMGGSMDILCTEEIRVLHALLQTIHNPMLDIPLVTVLGSRVFGFTANELAQIRSKSTGISFYNTLKRNNEGKVAAFLAVLEELRQFARMNGICSLLQRINTVTRLDSVYAAMDDGDERIANLQAFSQFAASYESTGNGALGQFLEHLDVVAEKGMVVSAEQTSVGCVTVMSIHKSKGLEFPVVFLAALSRRFNHESAYAQVLCDKELGLGLACVDRENRVRYPSVAKKAIAAKIVDDDVSEEMRVLYVAMTRAKDRLIMTYAAKKVETDFAQIANRIDYTDNALLSGDASCPGQWILQAAVKRTEAGVLLGDGYKPDTSVVSEYPWKVDLISSAPDQISVAEAEQLDREKLSEDIIRRMRDSLKFQYGFDCATTAPSKQTATQLKGREKDTEVAENTAGKSYIPLQFRKPSFVSDKADMAAFGNTVHLIMQHLDYSTCCSAATIKSQIAKLIEDGYIDKDLGEMVDASMIYGFFETEVGQQCMMTTEILHEFKFSVLVNAESYYPGCVADQILLQGVVDCALIENDGITVIDFKTDRVTDETVFQAADNYRLQVRAYSDALTQIYRKPVKAAYLYFFKLNKLIKA